jgi:zinc-ribbon domain
MSSGAVCAHCGAPVDPGATRCPACGATVRPADGPGATRPRPAAEALPPDLVRRIARLKQWSEAAPALGIEIPALPAWAEAAMQRGTGSDAWLEVVRGVERLAQKAVVSALESWEGTTRNRLTRLEAYSVDGRLERDQIEDVLHAARQGDLTSALQTFHQVNRVVALKERHLDQAREELERLVSLLRDMAALGLEVPADADDVAEDLERELRGGHLAALKQKLRGLRLQAVGRLKSGVPRFVSQYGEYLARQRTDGVAVELEAAELARAAHAFAKGRPEESLHRLRILQQVHGAGFGHTGGRPRGG